MTQTYPTQKKVTARNIQSSPEQTIQKTIRMKETEEGAPLAGFTNLIYIITMPLVALLTGIFGTSVMGNLTIEWSIMFASLVYLCVAWAFVYFVDLINPITPLDVSKQ